MCVCGESGRERKPKGSERERGGREEGGMNRERRERERDSRET